MDMIDWKPYFHIGFDGGIFLFPFLRLTSLPTFLLASAFTALLCWLERLLTLLSSRNYVPAACERWGRPGVAGWRAGMYGVLTFLRLTYMLVAMTFHVGLLLITVLALATSQFVIEYGELEHLPPTHTSYQHVPTHDLPHTHSSPPEAHGYPPSGPSSRRTGTAYHPYARARARGRAHKAHRSSVSFPDAYEQMGVEEERGRGSPYGPRVRDPHEAWPYVPEGWRGENGPGEEGEDEDEEEEEDNRPLGVQVGKASPGLWGAEARDKAREIMSGRS